MYLSKGRYVRRATLAPLALAALSVLMALWAQRLIPRPNAADPLIIFLVAGLLLVLAHRRFPRRSDSPFGCSSEPQQGIPCRSEYPGVPEPCPKARNVSPPAGVVSVIPAQAGIQRPGGRRSRLAPALLAAALAAHVLALVLFRDKSAPALPWLVFIPSVALGLAGLAVLTRRQRSPSISRLPNLLPVILIVMAAAFFRLYHLDVQPAGLFFDEAMYGLDARAVASGQAYPVYFDANYGRGALFIYLIVPFIKLADANVFALRLVPVFIGILTVPAVYAFAKSIFGHRPAVIAAALLAVSRWHVNFSRIAFDAILLPLLELLFFYFFLRAIRNRRALDFVWAGLVAGLGLNSYVAFRLISLVAAVCLLALLLHDRHSYRRIVPGVGALVLGTLLVASPFLQYYVTTPEAVNNRLQAASVLSGKSSAEAVPAVLENARKHLLMFNVQGDRNGRHNLPGEPMLDPVTAPLFVLGFILALYRLRRWPYPFLLLWFLAMLAGGILSVDFEAPQALRSIGALPIALLLAALVLDWLIETAKWQPGAPRRATTLAAAGLVLVAANLNFQNYFVRQAADFASWNDFSTGEALAAKEMKSLGSNWDFYVSPLYFEHPTVRFIAPGVKGYHRLEATDYLPLRGGGEKDVALVLDPQQTGLFAAAKRYYPNAVFKQLGPPLGGPSSLLEVQLGRDDILGVQGLVGRYYSGTEWSGEPLQRRDASVSFDWASASPLPAPFSVEWTGVVNAAAYGPTLLGIDSTGSVEVWLDEALLLKASGAEQSLLLPKGNHSLRVRAVVPRASGRTELYWQTPGGVRAAIPRSSLYAAPVTNNGLLGSYYPNANWSGEPALRQIDPSLAIYFHVTPLARPYSVEWRGKVEAPVAGAFAFGLESIDDSWLQIDGQPVVEAHVPNRLEEGRITLAAGWHDIRVRYLDKNGWSHVNLYWTRPGAGREVIPSERLLPPQGAYPETKPPPTLAAPAAPHGGTELPPSNSRVGATSILTAGEGHLAQPKDLALAPDGVYVADTANGRVVRFDFLGNPIGQVGERGAGPGQLLAPLAVAIAPDGDLLVLDEDTGYVSRFAHDGAYRSRIAGSSAGFYHPRGLAVGPDGTIYVADTGFARVVAFSPEGRRLRDLGGKGSAPGKLLGPVGIAVDGEGALWIADVDNHRVQRLSTTGEYLGSFDIPPGESVDGAHLALAGDSLYLTDSARGKIMRYTFDGRPIGEWGEKGGGPERLGRPVGIAIAPDGNIWVADRDNNRLQVFRPPS